LRLGTIAFLRSSAVGRHAAGVEQKMVGGIADTARFERDDGAKRGKLVAIRQISSLRIRYSIFDG
jgi:hypothetical protein